MSTKTLPWYEPEPPVHQQTWQADQVQPTDTDIVEALLGGDERAFAALVDTWTPAMLQVARRYVSTTATAEDVVQDTWVAVLRGLRQFRGDASLRTWVFRILMNVAKRRGGQEARITPWTVTSGGLEPTFAPEGFRDATDPWPGHWRSTSEPRSWGPEELLLADEVRTKVTEALHDLPERQRTVVRLRDVEGFDADEVCELLEISPANQRVLLHRGRSRVRAALDNYLAVGGSS